MLTQDKLLVQHSRTRKRYEIPIENNSISAVSLKAIKGPVEGSHPADKVSQGLRVYDPGLVNTAVGKSDVTWIDGNNGTVLFRGFTPTQLQSCEFEDIFYLMVWNDLPTNKQREVLRHSLAEAMCNIPSSVVDTIASFSRTTHPMPMLAAGLAAYIAADPYSIPTFACKTLYHGNPTVIDASIISTTAAYAVVLGLVASHRANKVFVLPNMSESFYYNLLTMMGNVNFATGRPSVKILRSMRRWGSVVPDHGQTNSTLAMSVTSSALADPLSSLISSLMAGYGPLHFGAQEAAYRTMQKIQTPDNVQAYLQKVKQGKERMHGFGHRSYKTVDPRIPNALSVLEDLGTDRVPLLRVARELDRAVQNDEFFQKRNLKANADLYGQFVYVAMGWGPEWSPALVFLQRLPGLMCHWRQNMLSEKINLIRPTDIFVGTTDQRTTEKDAMDIPSRPHEIARL